MCLCASNDVRLGCDVSKHNMYTPCIKVWTPSPLSCVLRTSGTAGATDRWRPSFTSSRVVCSSLHLSNICHGNSCDNRNDHASFSKPRTKTDRATTVSTEHHHLQQQQRRRQQRPQKVSQQGSSIDVPLTRQGVVGVGSAAAKMGFAGLLAGAGLGLFDSTTASRTAAAAADAGGGLVEEYSSPDGTFALHYPSTFKGFSKPLKTHKFEVRGGGRRRYRPAEIIRTGLHLV